jgi:hypothetical protein
MEIRDKIFREIHIPYKLVHRNQIYEIVKLHDKFIVKGFIIKTVNDKIDMVIINNPHPNANPRTGELCIPNQLRRLKITKNTLNMIRTMLCCFNLDDCYFTPWDEIEYRKQEVSGAWKTKTETLSYKNN